MKQQPLPVQNSASAMDEFMNMSEDQLDSMCSKITQPSSVPVFMDVKIKNEQKPQRMIRSKPAIEQKKTVASVNNTTKIDPVKAPITYAQQYNTQQQYVNGIPPAAKYMPVSPNNDKNIVVPPPYLNPNNISNSGSAVGANSSDSIISAYMGGATEIIRRMDLSDLADEQKQVMKSAFIDKRNLFVTGAAGTGKSYLIKRLCDIAKECGIKVDVTSTTGSSALNIDGLTIHSWSGIGICGDLDSALKRIQNLKTAPNNIKSCNILIIDEISMAAAHIIDMLDGIFRKIRKCDQPFGGIQIIVCGDFYQLMPVKSDKFAFESLSWKHVFTCVHELIDIFRQEDKEFCTALNEIRTGYVSDKTKRMFESCIGKKFNDGIEPTVLFPTNDDVTNYNLEQLYKLPYAQSGLFEFKSTDEIMDNKKRGKGINYTQKDKDDYLQRLNKECMAEQSLELCIGAQVMLIKNLDVKGGLVNGSRGVVIGFNVEQAPVIRFINGIELVMQHTVWNLKINEFTNIRRTQYPLKLAFAISLHKSQGMTLDRIVVNLGDRVFAGSSMMYVGLSRVRDIKGLSIIDIDWNKLHVDRRVREFYENLHKINGNPNAPTGPTVVHPNNNNKNNNMNANRHLNSNNNNYQQQHQPVMMNNNNTYYQQQQPPQQYQQQPPQQYQQQHPQQQQYQQQHPQQQYQQQPQYVPSNFNAQAFNPPVFGFPKPVIIEK